MLELILHDIYDTFSYLSCCALCCSGINHMEPPPVQR